MFKDFIRGMGSISLFPSDREEIDSGNYALSNEEAYTQDAEAYKKDLEMVGHDMWDAINKIEDVSHN